MDFSSMYEMGREVEYQGQKFVVIHVLSPELKLVVKKGDDSSGNPCPTYVIPVQPEKNKTVEQIDND